MPVAGSAARAKARSIGREERKADRDADTARLHEAPVTAPVFLLGKIIRLLPTPDGELRAADGDQPADHVAVERYLAKAFGDQLAEVRGAMEILAARYEPAELNRVGFRLYEKFRPDVPPGNEGWGVKAVLDLDQIRMAWGAGERLKGCAAHTGKPASALDPLTCTPRLAVMPFH